ncbi:hypothetical protein [uncultured Shewanella sp.]|uniref:hypothetical protein n=1 Tax=uncultured Shewanella sp. TaxID=173975 RepID=UPI00260C640F|nr:hypothetical protein [uncultured Shewanella sp.]
MKHTPTALTILFLLSACGGSGDDAKTPPVTETTPPNIVTPEPSKVIISSANYELINVFSWTVPEASIQLGMLTNNHLNILLASNDLSVEHICENNGSASIELLDKDNSNGVSTGDEVNIDYANCQSKALNTIVSGKQHLLINALSSDSSELISDFDISSESNGDITQVLGAFKVLNRNSTSQDYLSVEHSSDVKFSYLDMTDTWSTLFVEKSINNIDKTYDITFNFQLLSDGLESIVSCETKDEVSGLIYGEPNIFSIYCYGGENSLLHVKNSLETEEDGVGSVSNNQETFTFSHHFEDTTEGDLFQPITQISMDFMFDLATANIQDLRIESVIVDGLQHFAYVIGSNFSDGSKGNIHKVNLATMQSKELVSTQGIIKLAQLSKNGNILYLLEKTETIEGYDYSNVSIYSTENLSKVSSIDFNQIIKDTCHSCEATNITISDIITSPTENDTWFAVAYFSIGGNDKHQLLMLDTNGVVASSPIIDNNNSVWYGDRISLAIDADHKLFTLHKERNNSDQWLSQFELNAGSIEFIKKVKADDGESTNNIILMGSANGLVFTEKGKFFNAETLNLEWSAPFEPWMEAKPYPLIISSELNKVYQLHGSNWEPSFKTFSLDTGAYINLEKADYIEGAYEGLIISNGGAGYIVAVAPNKITRIGKSYLP